MPNTFGTASYGVPLVDPRTIRRNRARFRRDAIPELDLANSLYVPLGRAPARGWILLTREDYDSVRGYGTDYHLEVDQFDAAAPKLSFGSLAIVQARCVTTGVLGDPDAVYLVELTDRRGVLKNQWFQFPLNAYFNVLSPAYPTQFYELSMNGGTVPWSWSTMVGSIWTDMVDFLGTFPGLPSSPVSLPTNWNFPGVSAWDALCDILDHLGMGVSCNLTSSTPYSIVSLGASDAVFDALVARYAGRIEDDLEWIDTGAGRVPGTVTVNFHRVNQYYGTEETVRRDSSDWATNAVYSVSISAPAAFAEAVGKHVLWDDFPVRYDNDGNPLGADAASAAVIAAERVQQYFDLIYSRTSGYLDRTYTGVLPFYAGSQVDGVCWRQDFSTKRAGWVTQIKRGNLWEEIY